MRIDLPKPLLPGAVIDLEIAWRFPVPDYGGGRMGHDGTLYEFGQWYPRMASYDDDAGMESRNRYIGWRRVLSRSTAASTCRSLCRRYVVAATGRLRNPLTVLTAAQRTGWAAGLGYRGRASASADEAETRPGPDLDQGAT